MKIAIIAPDYPESDSFKYAFVHSRSKLYTQKNIQVKVFVVSGNPRKYIIDSISVNKNSIKELLEDINAFSPDCLAIHFPKIQMLPLLYKLKQPKVVWIHGHDIMWKFRLDKANNPLHWIFKRIILVPRELVQILLIRKLLKKAAKIVFVSKWIKKTAQLHSLCKYKNSVIIHNPVDTELFKYRNLNNSNTGISLRSFENSKYGLDILIKSLKKDENKDINVDLIGTGALYKKYKHLISRCNSSARIFNRSVKHSELPDLFYQYSFFVAPSRMETQGLAMCEAMSCGLPIIATNIGGIPEFVRHGIDGYLVPPNNPGELKKAIKTLLADKERMLEMSVNASNNIKLVCSIENTVSKEIDLLAQVIKEHKFNG